jgi:hypothetical protein
MHRLLVCVPMLALAACGQGDASDVRFCERTAEYLDRVTGERIFIDLDTMSQIHGGWDLEIALEWCDGEVLCDIGASQLPQLSDTDWPFPPGRRTVLFDHANRTIEGIASYRLYEPGSPGWDLYDQIKIVDDFDGTRQEYSLAEASMSPVAGRKFLDLAAIFDADGCLARIPESVSLPSGDAPFPLERPRR